MPFDDGTGQTPTLTTYNNDTNQPETVTGTPEPKPSTITDDSPIPGTPGGNDPGAGYESDKGSVTVPINSTKMTDYTIGGHFKPATPSVDKPTTLMSTDTSRGTVEILYQNEQVWVKVTKTGSSPRVSGKVNMTAGVTSYVSVSLDSSSGDVIVSVVGHDKELEKSTVTNVLQGIVSIKLGYLFILKS